MEEQGGKKRGWKKGRKFTQAHRDAISRAKTGQKYSDEHKKAISEGLKGRKHRLITRMKMSLAKRGVAQPASPKRSEGQRARWAAWRAVREAEQAAVARALACSEEFERTRTRVDDELANQGLVREAAVQEMGALRRDVFAWMTRRARETGEQPSLEEVREVAPDIHGKFIRYLALRDLVRDT
ncbi:unnamed protein product [Pedinophyceae sp. YPF-701]|nr:unnamed protein product [Pedinophyceae sp. YPF-701]